jgi:L-methionine (R)-S-oxide reductase
MDDLMIALHDPSKFLQQGNLDDALLELTETAANRLGAENCSIMLLKDGGPDDLRLRVCASHGDLPDAAYDESVGRGQGIAGRVLACGQSIVIGDISHSGFAGCARRPDDLRKSLISSPIVIHKRMVGVINVSGHFNGEAFTPLDVSWLELFALFIGKSIQAIQLQGILNSRFVQLALVQEAEQKLGGSYKTVLQHPDQLAKILAKSFYKEMVRAGFGTSHIINTATEIIGLLSHGLQQHNKRMARGAAPATGGKHGDA